MSVELSEEAVRNGILLNDSRLEIDILDNDDGEYIYTVYTSGNKCLELKGL